MITLVVVCIAALAGVGLMMMVQGLRGVAVLSNPSVTSSVSWPLMGLAALAGCVVWVATGWPVGAVIAVLAVGGLPKLIGRKQISEREQQRSEGVAIFTERVRDSMSSARGVTQALVDAASDPPEEIAEELTDFVDNVRRTNDAIAALQQLGRDLDDPFADLVIVVLSTAVGHSTEQTAPTISRLAQTIRDDQEWKLGIEVTRGGIRTQMRIVAGVAVLVVGYFYWASPEMLSAYNSAAGQLWLLVIVGMVSAAGVMFAKFSKIDAPDRFKARQRIEGVATS